MIKKQNLRINLLAAAVLSLTGMGMAHAAGLKASAPLSGPKDAQVEGIIVKYRAGTTASSSATAKLAVVNAALSRASLGGASAAGARMAALNPRVTRRLGTGADLISLRTRLGGAELAAVLAELKADPAGQYAVGDAIMYPLDAPARAQRGRAAARQVAHGHAAQAKGRHRAITSADRRFSLPLRSRRSWRSWSARSGLRAAVRGFPCPAGSNRPAPGKRR